MGLVDLLPVTVGAVTNPGTVIDVVATFLAALSGAIFAVERTFAISGVLAIATGIGGGVMRDVLSYEMPEFVKPRPISYLAAILGSILYVALVKWGHVDKIASEWVTIVFVFGLRMMSLKFGIRAPQPVDLPAKLAGAAAAQVNRRRHRRRDDGGT